MFNLFHFSLMLHLFRFRLSLLPVSLSFAFRDRNIALPFPFVFAFFLASCPILIFYCPFCSLLCCFDLLVSVLVQMPAAADWRISAVSLVLLALQNSGSSLMMRYSRGVLHETYLTTCAGKFIVVLFSSLRSILLYFLSSLQCWRKKRSSCWSVWSLLDQAKSIFSPI